MARPGSLFSFPNPVNEVAARGGRPGVLIMAAVALAADVPALLIPLAYGFWAQVLTGPSLSPLGQLATRVIAPRLTAEPAWCGPPKRFAQAIGLVVTTAAAVLVDRVLVGGRGTAGDDGRLRLPRVGAGRLRGLLRLRCPHAQGVIPESVCEVRRHLAPAPALRVPRPPGGSARRRGPLQTAAVRPARPGPPGDRPGPAAPRHRGRTARATRGRPTPPRRGRGSPRAWRDQAGGSPDRRWEGSARCR